MSSKLRTPALIVALIAAILMILVEMGGSFRGSLSIFDGMWARVTSLGDGLSGLGATESEDEEEPPSDFNQLEGTLDGGAEDVPGLAVAALIHLDFLLMATVLLFTLPLIISARLLAKTQGCLSSILGLIAILLGLLTVLKALASVIVMFALLLAIPFGTIVYMVLYATFDTTQAAAVMGTLMFLKIVMAIAIFIAHERFLFNKGFVALVLTSFLSMLLINFLHSFPPTFLVSVTDGVAAILVGVFAIIWGIVYLIGGLFSFVMMIKGTLL